MKRTGFAVLLLLLCPLWNTRGKATKNPQQLYAGIMVGWDQVEFSSWCYRRESTTVRSLACCGG